MTSANSKPGLTKSQQELIAFLVEARHSAIAAPLTLWIATSPRYAVFAEQYKDKIRKKLRVTREGDAIADLLHELQIPYWLLRENRFEVAYEPYASDKRRGPDYSVTFRTHFTFNIEVTHVRGLNHPPPASLAGKTAIDFRLVDILCSKLRQMIANMANLLFIAAAPPVLDQLDLPAHFAWIKDRAEHGDPAFYTRHRFSNPPDFFRYYERLSGLLLYHSDGAQPVSVWMNPQARVKLPDTVKNSLQRGFD